MPLPGDTREPVNFGGIEVWSDLRGDKGVRDLNGFHRALLFAELSHLVYWSGKEVERICDHIGIKVAKFLDRDGAQAYLFETEHDSIVACRGTEGSDWNDIKADLKALLVISETIGKVHSGFKKEADDLWPDIEKLLADNTKTLWFTGHSLGAAIAQICAGRCQVSDIKSEPRCLYTFGSPRTGNKRYINHVPVLHHRWVNNNDIVTRVPPPLLGYRHNGIEFYIDGEGKVKDRSGFERIKDRTKATWKGLFKGRVDPINDHMTPEYVKAIQNAIASPSN